MFLKLLKLKKKNITSSASRHSFFFSHNWLNQRKIKQLSLKKKWLSGRNHKGKIVIRTKSSFLKRNKNIKINYSFRTKNFGIISSFQFVPFLNRTLTLVFFSNGSISYYLTSERQKIFSFFFYKNIIFQKFKFKVYFFMIFQIKKLSFISAIESKPGSLVQYVRSPGSIAKIINFDKSLHTSIIKLPSGVKKIFSFYTFALLGKTSLTVNKFFKNNKAGYWRSFGKKPIVRGVAMNPIDHPHGGQTKSIRYPRTPWGKTTKFK